MIAEQTLKNFYFRDGKSAQDIADILHCSVGQVAYWMRRYNMPRRSLGEAIYIKKNPGGDPFQLKNVNTLKNAKLLRLGLGLYWGEGNKKDKTSIRLGNTDPSLIRSFIKFLVIILGVDKGKLRFGLQIFSDIPKEKALKFWLENLKQFNVSRRQFFKVIITPARGAGTYRQKSKYGVLTVYFCNSKLKKLLDSMLPL
jgi:hypothetical protein